MLPNVEDLTVAQMETEAGVDYVLDSNSPLEWRVVHFATWEPVPGRWFGSPEAAWRAAIDRLRAYRHMRRAPGTPETPEPVS